MALIQIGKKYKKLKCHKCNKKYKSYAFWTVKTPEDSERAGLQIGQRLCTNCLMALPLPKKEEERLKKLEEKWEQEQQERMRIGRERAADPEWNKKLQERMMEKMGLSCIKTRHRKKNNTMTFIPNYENRKVNPDAPIFRKLSWFECFCRYFRKQFIQTYTHTKSGILIISADNPSPSKYRTKHMHVYE